MLLCDPDKCQKCGSKDPWQRYGCPDAERRTDAMDEVLREVRNERLRQHDKWGEQDHPNVTQPEHVADVLTFGAWLEAGSRRTLANGHASHLYILLEEVGEAVQEVMDDEALEEELIQVAAVATQWAECIRRRRATR